jgi:isopenicillin-N epimerase
MNELATRHWAFAPGLVFFNHGSFGACAQEVLAAQRAWVDEMERNPVHFLGRRSAELLRTARGQLAAELGARSDDLAWMVNATQGVDLVVQSLLRSGRLAAGDEVLVTDHEYGACESLLQRASARAGVRVHPVPLPLACDDGEVLDRIVQALTARTRLLLVSHITSATARRLPVAALAQALRERGVLTLVDAAHAPGQIDLALDAQGADFTAGNLHKWMGAPKGSAFLHVRPEHHGLIEPGVAGWGWRAEQGESGHEGSVGASVLERRLLWLGTRDISPWLALPAALDFHRRVLRPGRARCRALLRQAQRGLLDLLGAEPPVADDQTDQMALLPLRSEQAVALQRWLFEHHHIEMPATRWLGAAGERRFLRLSVQVYNDEADVAALHAALAEALRLGLFTRQGAQGDAEQVPRGARIPASGGLRRCKSSP